jgi:hypothetical protein
LFSFFVLFSCSLFLFSFLVLISLFLSCLFLCFQFQFWCVKWILSYFKSQFLVQGCKMGSKRWIWKNKFNWKLFEIYKIDLTCQFSKMFDTSWRNWRKLEATAEHVKKNKKKWKKKNYC